MIDSVKIRSFKTMNKINSENIRLIIAFLIEIDNLTYEYILKALTDDGVWGSTILPVLVRPVSEHERRSDFTRAYNIKSIVSEMLNDKFDIVKRRIEATYFIYKNYKIKYGKWFVKHYIPTSMNIEIVISMV